MLEEVQSGKRDTWLVAAIAAVLSVVAFVLYFTWGSTLLYGDAVAHIHIARRVFDSRTPGLTQLGTTWLPLPHVLMMPFLVPLWSWRTGAGASVVSMAAFVFGTAGVFRLVRGLLRESEGARVAAWFAAAVYATNPNLLYMQTTAMTEALFLALMIWATVFLAEFVNPPFGANPAVASKQNPRASGWGTRSLYGCALCLCAASLTRYDAWFAMAFYVPAGIWAWWRGRRSTAGGLRQLTSRQIVTFVLIAGAGPLLWLAYNAWVFGNPIEFLTGPYSPRAIAERTTPPGSPLHPGANHIGVAAIYFWKAARLNLGFNGWEWPLTVLAIFGAVVTFRKRSANTALLLWLPLAFYPLSIAYGSVPIFMPQWWPFSYYNVRYGLNLLPAFAVFTGIALAWLYTRRESQVFRATVVLVFAVAAAMAYGSNRRPITFAEGQVNARTRVTLERQLATKLLALPPRSTILMYTGTHVGALQRAGIPLSRIVNEGNWGEWQFGLRDPNFVADYAVMITGDETARAFAERRWCGVRFEWISSNVPEQGKAAILEMRNAPAALRSKCR